MPSRRPRRHVCAFEIVVLMTSRAIDRSYTKAVASAPDIHEMRMQIISLPRVVARGMAYHTARMTQNRKHRLERSNPCFPAGGWLHQWMLNVRGLH